MHNIRPHTAQTQKDSPLGAFKSLLVHISNRKIQRKDPVPRGCNDIQAYMHTHVPETSNWGAKFDHLDHAGKGAMRTNLRLLSELHLRNTMAAEKNQSDNDQRAEHEDESTCTNSAVLTQVPHGHGQQQPNPRELG